MTEPTKTQHFWKAQGLPAPGTRMTAREFDALPETLTPIEFIHGVVVYPHWSETTMSPAPTPDHQDIVLNLGTLLKAYANANGGKVYVAPLDVYLSASVRVQPDVMWLAADSACQRTDTALHGAPDLVVEVLSPGTARRDRTEKFDLYELNGVREYWLVDPRDRLVEVYTRDADGFRRVGAYTGGQALVSGVLDGIAITASALFEM